MKSSYLAVAALAASIAGPALAQTAPPANAPIPQNGGTVQVEEEADVETTLGAGALPGVGIGTATTTETNGSGGPGGLQNGVGAQGTLMPDSSGEAGNTMGGVTGATGTPGTTGIPIGTTPGATTTRP